MTDRGSSDIIKYLIGALTCLCLYDKLATAQGPSGPWELTLAASAVNGSTLNGVAAAADVAVGYNFNRYFEMSLRQSIQFSDVNVSSALIGFSRFALDLEIPIGPDDRFIAFAGANGGYLWGQAIRQSAEAAPEVGIKYFIDRSAFIFVMAEYRIFFNAYADARESFSHGDFVYTAGVGFRF